MNRRPLRFIAVAYAAAVLWVTVGPAPWHTRGNELGGGILNPESWTTTTTWTTGYFSEMAFNVAMFVPVGLMAALLIPRRRWPLALLAGVAFTTVIELVQVPELDRISDPRDLVMNTSGAMLGVLIVLAGRMVRRAGAVGSIASDPLIGPAAAVGPVAAVEPSVSNSLTDAAADLSPALAPVLGDSEALVGAASEPAA
jgi:hypothetical protein